MTSQMKPKEIRRRASGDLREEVKRLEKAVFDQRFRGQSEEKSDRGLVRRSRRDVARVLTILRERELAESAGTRSAAAAPAPAAPAAAKKASSKPAAGKKKE